MTQQWNISNRSPAQGAFGVAVSTSPTFRSNGVFTSSPTVANVTIMQSINGGAPISVFAPNAFAGGFAGSVTPVSDGTSDWLINPASNYPANAIIQYRITSPNPTSYANTGSLRHPVGAHTGFSVGSQVSTSVTTTFLFKFDTNVGIGQTIDLGYSANNSGGVRITANNVLQLYIRNGAGLSILVWQSALNAVLPNTWYRLFCTVSSTTNTLVVYLNNVDITATGTLPNLIPATVNFVAALGQFSFQSTGGYAGIFWVDEYALGGGSSVPSSDVKNVLNATDAWNEGFTSYMQTITPAARSWPAGAWESGGAAQHFNMNAIPQTLNSRTLSIIAGAPIVDTSDFIASQGILGIDETWTFSTSSTPLMISKLGAYAVLDPPSPVSIAKVVAYAVLGPLQPDVINQDPAPDATFVDPSTDIEFRVTDINASALLSVTIAIDGGAPVDVIIDGVFQPGYSGSFTVVGNDIDVAIDPAADFVFGSEVEVTVTAAPPLDGEVSESWTFSTITHVELDIDHCEIAKHRLAWQFHERTHLNELVCDIGDRCTEIEQGLADVKAFRSIETAFGDTLDNIGRTIGQPRNGLSDADYRVRLRARAQVIGSMGRPDELLAILVTLDDGFDLSQITLTEEYPAAVVLHCQVAAGEQPLGEAFARFLIQAKAAGVKIILEFEEQGVTLFSWSTSPDDPAPSAGSGWAEISGGPGGRWAEAVGSDRSRRS